MLCITIPLSCRLKRSELLKELEQSQKDHPEDLDVFTGIGGKEARVGIVEKALG